MYGHQPLYYSGYPSNVSYNPYHAYQQQLAAQRAQERAEALAEHRARRAQYLPDEEDGDDDEWWSSQWDSRHRANLEAKARQEALERLQLAELRRRQAEESRIREAEELMRRRAIEQQQKRREELGRRLEQEEEARRLAVESLKNQMRMKREAEAAQLAALENERDAQRSHSRSPSSHQPTGPRPNVPTSSSETPAAANAPEPSAPDTQSSEQLRQRSSPEPTVEQKNEAASRIQNLYRIHSSFRTLHHIQSQFEQLRKDFVYPRAIDFEKPDTEGDVIRVPAYRAPSDFDEENYTPMEVDGPEGKLAFTSTNFALHDYSNSLDKLLMKLDGIESWGRRDIREQRRTAVKAIEKEASKLDKYWKQAWLDSIAKTPVQRTSNAQDEPSQLDIASTESPDDSSKRSPAPEPEASNDFEEWTEVEIST